MFLPQFFRWLFRMSPLSGIRRLIHTEANLVRITQEHTRHGRDLRREVAYLDAQIENKQREIGSETSPGVLAVLRSELHTLKKDLERKSTRISVLTDQRDNVAALLEKLQVARLAAGHGSVSIDEIDAITTEVENAASALDDRRMAMQDLAATRFTTDYQAPELRTATQNETPEVDREAPLPLATAPATDSDSKTTSQTIDAETQR